MTGVAALALCAAFTSCSKSEELYNPDVVNEGKAVSIVEKYNQAFLKYVGGTIAPNQTWGFGGYSAAATRAGGEFADHHGNYSDGNMWTSKGFRAPDPLTDGQKLRVQYYFQMTKITNPNQPDNLSQDFFMQQVYDGGTDPITKYKEGDYSPEVYKDAGGNTITSGDHMDHLTAGPGHLHIYNFNNSTCGWYNNVANWDQTDVNDKTQQHKDQIELMLNTPTSCFGYANSNNTEIYDDQWTLVAGSVIDNFCENVDPQGYADFLAAHPNVVDAKVVDTWNRSFMGFDFKLMPNPDPIRKDNGVAVTAKYGDADGSLWGYAYNGTSVVSYSENNAEILVNGQPIPVVIDNLNFFAAENIIGVGGQDNHNDFEAYKDFVPGGANNDCLYLKNHTQNVQGDHVALNLKFIERMVNDGFLPVYGKHLKLWVKVSDLTDGYYTDWIVSFMPASYNPPTPPSDPDDVCIIAEDLSAQGDTDFDFNDVVFTVEYTSTTTAKVTLYAAGGTLPLKVAGREVHDAFGYANPDAETGKYKMINTGDKADVNDVAPVVLFENLSVDKSLRGNDIVIEVDKGSKNEQGVYVENWITLTATGGEPAAKLCVGTDFATGNKWCAERESIKTKYPVFSAWVTEHPTLVWWK